MIQSNNKRIARNTLILYLRMILTMLISLYTSRILLDALGVDDFGIYNIVGGIVVLFSFLHTAMNNTSQRFLSFELGKGDIDQLKKVFSICLSSHILIALLVLILAETIGLWFLNNYMNIPAERVFAANWVFQFSIITFCINTIVVPYTASIIAYERMSLFALVSIGEVILRLIVASVIYFFSGDRLILYAILMAGVSIAIFFTYRIVCNIKIKTTKYKFFWDPSLFKKIISFSGWSLLGQTSVIASTQGVNILLNIFYSVTINATMGIANQVNTALNSLVSNFQSAFRPQITKLYAQNDDVNLYKLIYQTSKLSFFLLYVIALPIILNMESILSFWLKIVPEYAAVFCVIIIVSSMINAIAGPLWMAVFATGKIKKYQIIISLILLSDLLFAYFALKWGYPPYSVLLIKTFINLIALGVRVYFAHLMIDLSVSKFLYQVIIPILLVILITLPLYFILKYYYNNSTLLGVFITSLFYFLYISLIIFFIGIGKGERSYIISILRKKMKR